MTPDAITYRDRGVLCQANQLSEVSQMKLAIGIGKGNAVKASGLEPRAQGGTIAAILSMADQANMRKMRADPLNHLYSTIAAAVVYDKNLIIIRQFGQRRFASCTATWIPASSL